MPLDKRSKHEAGHLTPSPQEFTEAATALRGRIIHTPTVDLAQDALRDALPEDAEVALKLELLQQAGSFKARGALLGVDGLSPEQRTAGVVAASGGNHALAVSWAAKSAGVPAHIFMPEATDPIRIDGCRAFGATITLVSDIAAAFAGMQERAEAEGLTVLHPFEGRHMTLGAGSCGLEFVDDRPNRSIFIIPVGGGGLISGMAAAIRQRLPEAEIYGVEPEGADSMSRSLDAGEPVAIEKVNTIADSLGAPYALPYSFEIAKENVTGMVRVPDDALRKAMRLYFDSFRIIAEPACAAALAALTGPLKHACQGAKVGIIACGSNISLERYRQLLATDGR